MDPAHGLHDARQSGGGNAEQCTRRVVLPVEHRSGGDPCERALERVAGGHSGKHDVRFVEIDSQSLRSDVDVAERRASRELLEEVLDQVLLREALDQLDLLHRNPNLVRERAGEIDLRRSVSDKGAE